jgi:AGCS family alanine or glycine:cation symporter
MWVTGLFGMVTKYAETLLGVKYRKINDEGEIAGGPMYYIKEAMGKKWPAALYAFFGLIGAIGLGNLIQANSISQSLTEAFNMNPFIIALLLMILTAFVVLRGIKSIGKVTEIIVPIMIAGYFITALIIVITHVEILGDVFRLIIQSAFNPTAATGGFVGVGVLMTIRMGVARGLFSNESGLGSAAVVAAAARTKKPKTQALIAMTQTFIDTIIVCSLTGIVIIISGVWDSGLNGVALTTAAFATSFPGMAQYMIAISLSLFAFSTIIGWSYYGEKFLEYLRPKHHRPYIYRIVYVLVAGVGALMSLELVWAFADISAAMMAIPNLIALLILLPKIKKASQE